MSPRPPAGSTRGHSNASSGDEPPLAEQLRDALRENALALHYQPIVAADHTLLAAEALLRWPHPTRGLLGPDTILACAHQSDLEVVLDQWVLHTAAREAASWPATPHQAVSLSVNLSALTPGHPELTGTVAAALAESGLPGDQLILELVEDSLPTPLPQARQGMQHLGNAGIRWALDDFGTGYSNLARLKNLPFDVLKLDRSLTTDLTRPTDTALVQAATTMAGALDCVVIAEGIETQAQLDQLYKLGIPGDRKSVV